MVSAEQERKVNIVQPQPTNPDPPATAELSPDIESAIKAAVTHAIEGAGPASLARARRIEWMRREIAAAREPVVRPNQRKEFPNG